MATGYHFRPAEATSPKKLVGLYSESGCGKTFSALLLAKGYAGDMSKVGMIETESGRGELYASHKVVGGYRVLSMADNFSPHEYGKAIDVANHAGLKVLIIDSASHEWEGVGGVLSMAADNEAAGKKGSLVWQKPKIDHQREFMLRLTQTPIDLVIVCMRAKYPMEQIVKDGKKDWQRSKDLAPKQSEDILFEMLVHGWPDVDHKFHITKPRGTEDEVGILSVFEDGKPITVETGRRLSIWVPSGAIKQETSAFITRDQAGVINSALKSANIDPAKLFAHFSIKRLGELTVDEMAEIEKWIAAQTKEDPVDGSTGEVDGGMTQSEIDESRRQELEENGTEEEKAQSGLFG